MKKRKKILHMYMPNGGEAGVILLWRARHKNDPHQLRWVECRGLPFSEWEEDEVSPMQRLHDCMPGWHTCVLHQDAVLTLHTNPDDPGDPRNHRDFEAVEAFFSEGVLGQAAEWPARARFNSQDIKLLEQ